RLRRTYTGTIGAEFMHIADHNQRRWLQTRLEQAVGNFLSEPAQRLRVLDRLTAAEGLERYLHTKYVGQKRFSLEGGESLIPLLDTLIDDCGRNSVREMVIGMAHRGRLNVLINTLGKPSRLLFDEFEGKFEHADDPAHSGDVKYHMGFSADVRTAGGPMHVALAFNPSHLEIVNPMVLGSVRARQTRRGDSDRREVLPVLIHGDAALAGQGVNAELFNLSQTRGFSVGGTVHVVINNQIGFTISRQDDARSTHYCTDIIKMINAPVLHVNGDDPEAVVFCARLAFDYRQTFKRDIMIDLICYRRHGHNEADEPAATQPRMYQVIRNLPTTLAQYAKRLADANVISSGEAEQRMADYRKRLEAGEPVTELSAPLADAFRVDWSPYLNGMLDSEVVTGVARDKLARLEAVITDTVQIKLHPRVAKIYDDRRKMAAGQRPLDWGYAENLAYATLLEDGYGLRLVGQDSARGTFFHR
ncbi:alpha-ketoglutarate decarboxylase, partial [mine drainage metagenome]